MDDTSETETALRLPRRDVPPSLQHELNGHTRRKNGIRSVVGRTNRATSPLSRSVFLGGGETGDASFNASVASSAVDQLRASSSMSQRRFLSSTLTGYGSEHSFAPQRSLTPQSFWFGASFVGAQGTPQERGAGRSGLFANPEAPHDVVVNRSVTAAAATRPPLLSPTKILLAMTANELDISTGARKKTANTAVVQSVAGALPAADGSTVDSLPMPRAVECEVPRSHSVPPELHMSATPAGRVQTTAGGERLRRDVSPNTINNSKSDQLMRFFRSESGIDDKRNAHISTLPNLQFPRPHTRVELTPYPSTFGHTQAQPGTAQFVGERARFNPHDRGLEYPAELQRQRLSNEAHFEVRAKRRNENLERVTTACTAYDQRLEKKKESRILHKAEVLRQLKRQLDEAEKRAAHNASPATVMER